MGRTCPLKNVLWLLSVVSFCRIFISFYNGQPASINGPPSLPAGGRSALSELDLAGRIFGDVAFELGTPQRLKGPAASVQGLGPGKISVFTPDVTPLDPVAGNPRVICHQRQDPFLSKIMKSGFFSRICARTVFRNSFWEMPNRTFPSSVRTERVPDSFSLAPMVRISGI